MIEDHESQSPQVFSPLPIAIGDVVGVLQRISPPSVLQRVPARLLSVPLLQRHHFLNISPDDPAAYLTWPGGDSQRVLDLLEAIRPEDLPEFLSVHDDAPDAYIRYAADPEAVYAHVRINSIPAHPSFHFDTQSSLRLIFLWDQPSSSWRYHNSALGDFPKHAQSDLSHAMAFFHSPDDFLPEHIYSFGVDSLDDNDDVYWNAYGSNDQSLQPASLKAVPEADTEDAYWAQYASIQGQCAPESPPDPYTNKTHSSGSADSTIPSPRPRDHQTESDQRIFVPSSELNPDLPQSELYNPLAPPSPSSLSRRLASLPTYPDSPPLQEEDSPSSASASVTPASPQSPDAVDLVGPKEHSIVFRPPSENTAVKSVEVKPAPADEALKTTIRGLYQLWQTGEKSQLDFLALVKQAVEE